MKTTISNLFDLKGKTAIITGGAMGIGKGIAMRLAEAGASVLIADIVSPLEAENTLKELRSFGGKISYLQIDLNDAAHVSKVVDKVIEEFGDIHILVNNAGIYRFIPFTQMTEELWDKTININLKAVAFLSKAVVNVMIEKKHGGRIINISSIDGMKPTGNLSQYDSSKGGLRMLTKAIAKEVGNYGITVNDIAPGGITTPGSKKVMGNNVTKEQAEAMQKQTDQFIKTLPLRRMGEPEDIGNAALFLASDASAYMTGSTMIVDGGMLLV